MTNKKPVIINKTQKKPDGSCFVSYSEKILYRYIDITDTTVFEQMKFHWIEPNTLIQFEPDTKTKKIIERNFDNLDNWINEKSPFTEKAKDWYWNFVFTFFYDCLQRDENKNLTWGICTLWQLQNFCKNFKNITFKKYLNALHHLFESNPKAQLPKINEKLRALKHKEIIEKLGNNKITDTEKIMIDFLTNEKDFLMIKGDESKQTVIETEQKIKHKFTLRQIALICFYNGTPIARNNSNDIAKKFGYISGEKLYQYYIFYSSRLNRINEDISKIKTNNKLLLIESIIPELNSEKAKKQAQDEYDTLKAKENKYLQ